MALVALVFSSLWIGCTGAATFLDGECKQPLSLPPTSMLNVTLYSKVNAILGGEPGSRAEASLKAQIDGTAEGLRSSYESVAKNGHGRLDASAARYVLHRYFRQQFGWLIQGLEPDGDGWTGVSAFQSLSAVLPQDSFALFDQHIRGQGVALHELALVATLFKMLVHKQTEHRLDMIYYAYGLDPQRAVKEEQLLDVVDTFMASYVLGTDASVVPETMRKQVHKAQKHYPSWLATRDFARQVRKEFGSGSRRLGFQQLLSEMTEVTERHGRWQDRECLVLKEELLALGNAEDQAIGRIDLKDFYREALNLGKIQFSESVSYLTQVGAVDDRVSTEPKVLVSNWLYSFHNCLDVSSKHSICCLDKCEAVLGDLEQKLAHPYVAAASILSVLASKPELSMKQWLTPKLQARLDQISEMHRGLVPLHGRLFAQWLHHAFPHECAYPHMFGTTRQLRPRAYLKTTGRQATASQDEMQQYVEQRRSQIRQVSVTDVESGDVWWDPQEELFVPQLAPKQLPRDSAEMAVRTLAALWLLTIVTLFLLRLCLPVAQPLLGSSGAQRRAYTV